MADSPHPATELTIFHAMARLPGTDTQIRDATNRLFQDNSVFQPLPLLVLPAFLLARMGMATGLNPEPIMRGIAAIGHPMDKSGIQTRPATSALLRRPLA
jgi:hypothetical protein